MRRAVGPVLVLALLTALALPAAASTPPRVAFNFFGTPSKVRPTRLGVGAKGGLEHITWSSWGGRYARGQGIYDIAGFAGDPGSGYRHSARLTFSRRATCKGRRAYTKLVIHYSKPIGGAWSDTISPWGDC
jgi:hypothetical protein